MRMTNNDPWRPFVESTLNHFSFLVEGYGFRHVSTQAVAYECAVIFENETTRVTVDYEMGSPPWVAIGRIEQRSGKAIVRDETSLEIILSEKGLPDVEAPAAFGDIPDEEIDEMLRLKAISLRKEADDLLRGNFESLPNLLKATEENAKKRNLELFGTESGETRK